LIEQERVRAEVQAAFELLYRKTETSDEKSDNYNRALDHIEQIGPAAIPLLIGELEQGLPYNFAFVSVALGRFGTPEVEQAFRDAIAVAETQDMEFAANKKGWACYGLASMGVAEAVDLLNRGRHLSAKRPVHGDMTMLEAAALFTAPESIPLLHAQLVRYDESDDPEIARERRFVLKALRRIGDPSSIPKIIPLLHDADPAIRRAAADALHVYDTSEAVAALMQLLKDEKVGHVRFAAAWSLEQVLPSDRLSEFVERLSSETETSVRGVLYRIIVRIAGPDALELLRPYLGRPDPADRADLLAALSIGRLEGALPMFRAGIGDDNNKVMLHAVSGLGRLGSERAHRALIEQLGSSRWLAAREALHYLALEGDTRATAPVVRRLLDRELRGVVHDPYIRERVYFLGDGLVDLNFSERPEDWAPAVSRQRDGNLVVYLEQLDARLDALETCGDELDCWKERLASTDAEVRKLAIRRVGELGGPAAAEALGAVFGRVDVDDGAEILRALGTIDDPASRTLIERVLASPIFDPAVRAPLREMAAWSARRLGGEDMARALRESARRRTGEDVFTLIYLAQLEGRDAIPLLEDLRITRMRHPRWTLSDEMELLDKLVRELRAGRTIEAFDVAPEEMRFNRTGWIRAR
jgi:HEAT repeat protein